MADDRGGRTPRASEALLLYFVFWARCVSCSFSWMVRLLISSLVGMYEDFNGEVPISAPSLSGVVVE